MRRNRPYYSDLASYPEDDRITIIVKHAEANARILIPIDNEEEKIQRYMDKIEKARPGMFTITREPGLVPNTACIKVVKK